MTQPVVGIVIGSDSDLPIMKDAAVTLEKFGLRYELVISSAHRLPEQTAQYAQSAAERGLKVIIAAAGGAAHLAGIIAAHTVLPVIGVPIRSDALSGLDSLYSTVQMPPGVPVATVAINGSRNAALLTIQILALDDPFLTARLNAYKRELAEQILDKNTRLNELGMEKYLEEMRS